MNTAEHLLSCLGEEGAEIAQDCSKSNRFGLQDVNVLIPNGPTNQVRLVSELNDMMGVIYLCIRHGIIPADWLSEQKVNAKIDKVEKYMTYARSIGVLKD